jgi:hypothetical protein
LFRSGLTFRRIYDSLSPLLNMKPVYNVNLCAKRAAGLVPMTHRATGIAGGNF